MDYKFVSDSFKYYLQLEIIRESDKAAIPTVYTSVDVVQEGILAVQHLHKQEKQGQEK